MKIALVTGGSRGIGAATVTAFARNGYTVILNYNRSKTQAEALRNQLLNQGCDVHLYQADVADFCQVRQMFQWIAKYFKKLDVLVNNAGVSCTALLQDVTAEQLNRVLDVNAKGAFWCCQQALPLLSNCSNPSVVNVSSIWGYKGASCESAYAMSKFAVVGLTLSLAEEWQTVDVSCVCPPIVLSDMNARLTQKDIADFCADTNTHAYTPDQVADVIYNLATNPSNGKVVKM